jgi:hypothetical protein
MTLLWVISAIEWRSSGEDKPYGEKQVIETNMYGTDTHEQHYQ